MPALNPYLDDEEDEEAELWRLMSDPGLLAQATPPSAAPDDDAVFGSLIDKLSAGSGLESKRPPEPQQPDAGGYRRAAPVQQPTAATLPPSPRPEPDMEFAMDDPGVAEPPPHEAPPTAPAAEWQPEPVQQQPTPQVRQPTPFPSQEVTAMQEQGNESTYRDMVSSHDELQAGGPTEPQQSGNDGPDEVVWAALADLMMNRGQGVGRIVAGNQQMQERSAQQAIDNKLKAAQIEAYRNRAAGGGVDPAVMEIRRGHLRAREEQNANQRIAERRQQQGFDLRAEKHRIVTDPSHPLNAANKAFWSDLGISPELIEHLNQDQVFRNTGMLEKLAELQLSGRKAEAAAFAKDLLMRTEARMGAQLAGTTASTKAHETAAAEDARRQVALPYEEAERYRVAAQKFASDYKADLDLVGLIEQVNNTPGGAVSQSWIEQAAQRVPVMGRFVDDERQGVTAARRFIVQRYKRGETGMAATLPEERGLVEDLKLMPLGSDEEVQAAWDTLTGILLKRVRGAAVGREEAVRDVLKRFGDADAWLGTQAPTAAQPSAATPGEAQPAGPTAPARTNKLAPEDAGELGAPQPMPTIPAAAAAPAGGKNEALAAEARRRDEERKRKKREKGATAPQQTGPKKIDYTGGGLRVRFE